MIPDDIPDDIWDLIIIAYCIKALADADTAKRIQELGDAYVRAIRSAINE